MSTTEETQEKRPELFEKISLNDKEPINPLDPVKCPCGDTHHFLKEFKLESIRVYDYAILDRPIYIHKTIIVAFMHEGKNHRAVMNYNEKTHQLLESFKGVFRQGYAVLVTPIPHETPEGWSIILRLGSI